MHRAGIVIVQVFRKTKGYETQMERTRYNLRGQRGHRHPAGYTGTLSVSTTDGFTLVRSPADTTRRLPASRRSPRSVDVRTLCQDESVNLLEDIIAGATDDTVSTGNLLRKVKIVAHYLKAVEVSHWVTSELNGYPEVESLPVYRASLLTPVMGKWTGYFGTSATQLLSSVGIPEDAEKVLFHTNMNQPLAELEDLAALPEDLSHAWDPWQVGQYS